MEKEIEKLWVFANGGDVVGELQLICGFVASRGISRFVVFGSLWLIVALTYLREISWHPSSQGLADILTPISRTHFTPQHTHSSLHTPSQKHAQRRSFQDDGRSNPHS